MYNIYIWRQRQYGLPPPGNLYIYRGRHNPEEQINEGHCYFYLNIAAGRAEYFEGPFRPVSRTLHTPAYIQEHRRLFIVYDVTVFSTADHKSVQVAGQIWQCDFSILHILILLPDR